MQEQAASAGSGRLLDQPHNLWHKGVQGGALEGHSPAVVAAAAAAPAGEREAQLLLEPEWDTRTSMQCRRDLPEELVNKHPSLQNPDTQLPLGTTTTTQRAGSSSSPEPSPRTSGALPPVPPITGDLGSAQRSPGRVMSSHTSSATTTTTTNASSSTRLGPPNLARVSISQMSHEALDKTAHGDYVLVTHLGKECATCSSGTPASHVLTRQQQQLLSRAADLEAEQRQHAAAADEAARIAVAAAARASELEAEIRVEISERRTLLLQQEETARLELSRLESRRHELMGRVGTLQAQLASLVEEEEGLLRQQLDAESMRGELETKHTSMTASVRDIESLRESLLADVGRAEARLSSQRAAVVEAEQAVQEALRLLREAEARKAQAESEVVAAREAVESVLSEVSSVERNRETQLGELNSVMAALPSALSWIEGLRAQQRTLRARAEALEAEASGVKSEEESALERQTRLTQESRLLEQSLTELTARAHTLSCQAAAAAAKAAGARGLQAGEEARARAAAAEAEGLRAAAAALADADATSAAALMTTTISTTSISRVSHTHTNTHTTASSAAPIAPDSTSSPLTSSSRALDMSGAPSETQAGSFRTTAPTAAPTAPAATGGVSVPSTAGTAGGAGLGATAAAGGLLSGVRAADTADVNVGRDVGATAATATGPVVTEGVSMAAPAGTAGGAGLGGAAAGAGLLLSGTPDADAADLIVSRRVLPSDTAAVATPALTATESASMPVDSSAGTTGLSSTGAAAGGLLPGVGAADTADVNVGRGVSDTAAAGTAAGPVVTEGVSMASPAGFAGAGAGLGLGGAAAAGAGLLSGTPDAEAADLTVGRGASADTATATPATEGPGLVAGLVAGAGKLLKRGGSSSSSGEEEGEAGGVRDTAAQRDVQLGRDVHTAIDSPMPTPESLVPPLSTATALSSTAAVTGAAPGAGSGLTEGAANLQSTGPTVAYGSAEAERTLLPVASGRGADLMVGAAILPVSQRKQEFLQQQQQQQQQQQAGDEGASASTAAVPATRSGSGGSGSRAGSGSGRSGGLIASIKGMLGVAAAGGAKAPQPEEVPAAPVVKSTPTEVTPMSTSSITAAPTTATTAVPTTTQATSGPDRVPSHSLHTSSSSSSSSGTSSPSASGVLPEGIQAEHREGAAAGVTGPVPPADSTTAMGSDLPQSVRPPPSGLQAEEAVLGVLGQHSSTGAGAGSSSVDTRSMTEGLQVAEARIGSSGTQPQHSSNLQQLLQEEAAAAPAYVPEAAAARTASPDAPLELLGSPLPLTGDEIPLSPHPTPAEGLPPATAADSSSSSSGGRDTLAPASIAAVASEVANNAVDQQYNQQQYSQQQQQYGQQETMGGEVEAEGGDSSAFTSPSSSAYQTPASAFSLASSRGNSGVFNPSPLAAAGAGAGAGAVGAVTGAGFEVPAAAGQGSVGSRVGAAVMGADSSKAVPYDTLTDVRGSSAEGTGLDDSMGMGSAGMRDLTEDVGGSAESAAALGSDAAAGGHIDFAAAATEGGITTAAAEAAAGRAEQAELEPLLPHETASAAGGGGGGATSGSVYVGPAALAAGLDGLPAGTSMEGAVEAANELADAVEADRREEAAAGTGLAGLAGVDSSTSSHAELPSKAFDDLARPAGLVSGAAVSPHKHHHEQLGLGWAQQEEAAEGGNAAASTGPPILLGTTMAQVAGGLRDAGITSGIGGSPMAATTAAGTTMESPDTAAGSAGGSATGSPRSGGVRGLIKEVVNKPKELIKERFAEGGHHGHDAEGSAVESGTGTGTPKPLGRRSYKEAVEASLATTPPTTDAISSADTGAPAIPSTAGTLPLASAGPTTATTAAVMQPASPGFGSSSEAGMGGDVGLGGGGVGSGVGGVGGFSSSEVEEGGVDAPAGPLGAGSEGFNEPQQSAVGGGGVSGGSRGVANDSPRKRGFFGSLKKALGSSSYKAGGEA